MVARREVVYGMRGRKAVGALVGAVKLPDSSRSSSRSCWNRILVVEKRENSGIHWGHGPSQLLN